LRSKRIFRSGGLRAKANRGSTLRCAFAIAAFASTATATSAATASPAATAFSSIAIRPITTTRAVAIGVSTSALYGAVADIVANKAFLRPPLLIRAPGLFVASTFEPTTLIRAAILVGAGAGIESTCLLTPAVLVYAGTRIRAPTLGSLIRSRGLVEPAALVGPGVLIATRTRLGASVLLVTSVAAGALAIDTLGRAITRTTSVATTSAATVTAAVTATVTTTFCSGAIAALTAFTALASIAIVATPSFATVSTVAVRT